MNTFKIESAESFDTIEEDLMESLGVSSWSGAHQLYKDTEGNILLDTILSKKELDWIRPHHITVKNIEV